jgi:hypothetical protein
MVGVSLRTAIKDRAIVPVAINHFDRTVGLHRESDIAQHGPGGKLALKLRIHAFTVALSMEDSADADLGIDLVGGDFHLKLGGVAAITFARDVLRVTSGQRKIVFRQGRTDARGQSKTNAEYKWTDSSHYDSPTFSTRDYSRLMQRANAGFKRAAGSGRLWRMGAMIAAERTSGHARVSTRPSTTDAPTPAAW